MQRLLSFEATLLLDLHGGPSIINDLQVKDSSEQHSGQLVLQSYILLERAQEKAGLA